ncbi:MAG: hypothetical protein EP329_21895 [Deltaproteobacteria bacterium]|nr:MAG: hypothetical protein EP329_21895 [Deltaproteobacteria bacterium]
MPHQRDLRHGEPAPRQLGAQHRADVRRRHQRRRGRGRQHLDARGRAAVVDRRRGRGERPQQVGPREVQVHLGHPGAPLDRHRGVAGQRAHPRAARRQRRPHDRAPRLLRRRDDQQGRVQPAGAEQGRLRDGALRRRERGGRGRRDPQGDLRQRHPREHGRLRQGLRPRRLPEPRDLEPGHGPLPRVSTTERRLRDAARAATTLLAFAASACASAPRVPIAEIADPVGDVRLHHPDSPGVRDGSFDLVGFSLYREGEDVVAELTFDAPVRPVDHVRVAEDLSRSLLPQTVDIYLDSVPGVGHIQALPGRGFDVPAAEAWDWVLVISPLADNEGGDILRPTHTIARGRTLRATFRGSEVPREISGVLVAVLATSTSGEGRVRQVVRSGADCRVWDDARCQLEGSGPPILDATSDVSDARPVPLDYLGAPRPRPTGVRVAFAQGALLTASPVAEGQLVAGQLVTVVDAAGQALGTATVLSVAGDAASLRLTSGEASEGASAVIPVTATTPIAPAPEGGDHK